MAQCPSVTRRRFLRDAAAASLASWAAPSVVPGAALGKDGAVAPGQRIAVGMIGVGRQTVAYNLKGFLDNPDTQVVAVCDVDAWRLANAKRSVEAHYAAQSPAGGYRGCAAYGDFRELLARRDIDAVMISTPDHWHVPMSIAAAEAGKDVACEKPITRTIAEGRRLVEAIAKHERVFRVDSEFRSKPNFHRAAELIRNGRLGKIHTIRVGVPAGDNVVCPPCPDMPVPEGLDYESWQGPAPRAPYTLHRVHPPRDYGRPGWMRHLYYCDGMITNWGAHLCDVAQWCLGTERTGPVEIRGRGVSPPADSFWNVMKTFEIEYRFADGARMVYETSTPYVRFTGTEGSLYAAFPSGLEVEPASLLDAKLGDDEIGFPLKSEKQDFIDAVKSRGQTLEDAEVGHRTTSLCHLGHIAVQVGGTLQWDPQGERFLDNADADALIDKPIHAPKGS
ncbi:MAG: Gfo/Idh/MocA family oxidoreductase [Pirellulales bacterium]|nr:Gfo/Idh/MocA family oxidoreductase [Pirellulales bacterium]